MLFRCVLVMLGGMQVMSVSYLRMMRGLFVITGLVVLCSLAMVLGCMLMVVRGLLVMLMNVVIVHRSLPG
jgi:hypothetical protein